MTTYNTIAELQNFIVLDSYTKLSQACEQPTGYQTEAALKLVSVLPEPVVCQM